MAWTGAATIRATVVAGTIDILFAFASSPRTPAQLLRSVASGPFGDGVNGGGWPASLLGLLVHFILMAIMAGAFVLAAKRWPLLLRRPLISGLVYGLILYLVMYWIVLPLRWPQIFPVTDPAEVGKALFAHLILVGLLIAWIAARASRTSRTG